MQDTHQGTFLQDAQSTIQPFWMNIAPYRGYKAKYGAYGGHERRKEENLQGLCEEGSPLPLSLARQSLMGQ